MCEDWGWGSEDKPTPEWTQTELIIMSAGMHAGDLDKLRLLGHDDIAARVTLAVHHLDNRIQDLRGYNSALEQQMDAAKKAAASFVARWVTAAFIGLVISAVIIMTHCVPVG